jgi:glycosyltransferase involved in cell wall biosynthesis
VTHGREGLLVERKSRRQLAYALQTLAGNPALRREMGEAGRLKAKQYDWERVIDQVTAVYQQSIDSAQPAPAMRLRPSLSPR